MPSKNEKQFTSCNFYTSVFDIRQLHESQFKEIAFAGRSNCGKSSLINALVENGGTVGKKNLAIVSNRPGRTASLNFYMIDENYHFVDMPGYGFAKTSKKMQSKWKKLIFSYLSGRINLGMLLLLVDARRGIIKTDMEMLDYIQRSAVITRFVFTKSDLIKETQRKHLLQETEKILYKNIAIHPEKIWVSAKTKEGIMRLRTVIKEEITK